MFNPVEFDYIVRMIGEEVLIIKMNGTFADAYETARNYHIYAERIAIETGEGKEIISLTHDQLMDEGLKITYTP